MKTIPERAREIPNTSFEITERVLVELVEEIAVYMDEHLSFPVGHGDKIRRRFLGPPSAEAIATKAAQDYFERAYGPGQGKAVVKPCIEAVVEALREAGLLRETT